MNSQSAITLYRPCALEAVAESCYVEISDKLLTIKGKSFMNSKKESCLSIQHVIQ